MSVGDIGRVAGNETDTKSIDNNIMKQLSQPHDDLRIHKQYLDMQIQSLPHTKPP